MRSATSSSWELKFDVLEEPHIALFIRAALRFESIDGRQPPRLEGEVPDLRSLVGEEQLPQIMLGFRSWWQEEHLIDEWRVAPPVDGPEDRGESHRRLEARLANFYAPLAGQPELRRHSSQPGHLGRAHRDEGVWIPVRRAGVRSEKAFSERG